MKTFRERGKRRLSGVERGRVVLLMMIMIDFQFECLIIHVNESKSSGDNQVWEIITMIIPQLKAYHTSDIARQQPELLYCSTTFSLKCIHVLL